MNMSDKELAAIAKAKILIGACDDVEFDWPDDEELGALVRQMEKNKKPLPNV